MIREWLVRLLDWFRRDRMDRELQEELAFHARELERDARAAGQSAAEARRTARRRLGHSLTVRESARRLWSWPWLDQLHLNFRYAIRGLQRAPGFALTATLTLGLGIGANAAMFSVIDQLMFRPFAYLRDPASVNRVYLQYTYRGRDIMNARGFVVGQGIRFAVAGVVVGSAIAILLAQWIQPLLFQQSARDPKVYVTVGATLLIVAVAASGFPALRATRADPNAALRGE